MTDSSMNDKKAEFSMAADLGEAGGVAFTSIRLARETPDGLEVMDVNLTGRGHTAREALRNLSDGLAYAAEKGFSIYRKEMRAQKLPETSALPKAASTPAQEPAYPAPAATGAIGVIRAVAISTIPRADGKVNVEFYSAGHKWPDLTRVCKPDDAITFLAPIGEFTLADFAEPRRYGDEQNPLAIDVKWRASDRLNSKGNPYKDIVSIEVLTA